MALDMLLKDVSSVNHKNTNPQRKLSFCFISETSRADKPLLDPSVRYRCYHPAEYLLSKGHSCTVVSAEHFYTSPVLNHDVYVFHRPNAGRTGFKEIVNYLSRQGTSLIADYDDLIFGDSAIALGSSAVKNGTLNPKTAVDVFRNNLQAMLMFDKVTVSTVPLSEYVREYNPRASTHVVPNFIPSSVLNLHRDLKTANRKRPRTTIGYFAGTKSHDKDLPVVESVLHRVLSENPNFQLFVVGPVLLPKSLTSLPNVAVTSVVNYLRLPGLMSTCSTVIAPLEDSSFNSCKSRVKFLEAALAGCRLVASPIPDMTGFGDGAIALANSLDDWYFHLSNPLSQTCQKKLANDNLEILHPVSNGSFIEPIPASFVYESADLCRTSSCS
ncbi:MAG: glycosyltransferase involved in cell wall biosynthesis [Candidatus Azotimanducaceae bacterium]|jgi:glycosyltransferase involved in cell wall biosynthesis